LLKYYVAGNSSPLLFTIRTAEKEKEIEDKEAKAVRKAAKNGKGFNPMPPEGKN